MLKVRFRDVGLRRLKKSQFVLEDITRQRDLDLSKPWNAIVRPGQHISMSMIFPIRISFSSHCPGCGDENPEWEEMKVKWYIEDPKILDTVTDYILSTNMACGIIYSRIEITSLSEGDLSVSLSEDDQSDESINFSSQPNHVLDLRVSVTALGKEVRSRLLIEYQMDGNIEQTLEPYFAG